HYGVTTGEGTVVGADAFVMKGEETAPFTEWVGNPATEIQPASQTSHLTTTPIPIPPSSPIPTTTISMLPTRPIPILQARIAAPPPSRVSHN
ncbi:MAG: hypothetical protein QOC75_4613, partial [Pseudonocardiales bacterium]|nr:hypothetical protein [Pseudonocardiales bacterium]